MATNEAAKEVKNHGTISDKDPKKVKCNYCGHEVSGFYRLQHHLGGVTGDVRACANVSDDIKEYFKNYLTITKMRHLVREIGALEIPEVPPPKRTRPNHPKEKAMMHPAQDSGSQPLAPAPSAPVNRAEHSDDQQAITPPLKELESSSSHNPLSSHYLNYPSSTSHPQRPPSLKADVDFGAAKSQTLMEPSVSGAKDGDLPSTQDPQRGISSDEINEVEEYVGKIKQSWATTRCSLVLDGWVDRWGRSLISILVDCLEGPMYLQTLDITNAILNTQEMVSIFLDVVLKVGVDNVVQIISHTRSGCMDDVGKTLMLLLPPLCWAPNATQFISSMLQRIGWLNRIKPTIDGAKEVTRLVYNNPSILNLMRRHIGGCDLLKPYKIEAAIPFLTLKNMLAQKANIQSMFASSDWEDSFWASTDEGKKVTALMAAESFWRKVSIVVTATTPLVDTLSLIYESREHASMGFIFDKMKEVRRSIRRALKTWPKLKRKIHRIFDDTWGAILQSHAFAAASFLNPRFYYKEDRSSDSEAQIQLLGRVSPLLADPNMLKELHYELVKYHHRLGAFKGEAETEHDRLTPVEWWTQYGSECPQLQRLAIRILSQTCDGPLRYGLKRDMAEKALQDGVSYSEREQLKKLTCVQYNLHLKKIKDKKLDLESAEIGTSSDWISNPDE